MIDMAMAMRRAATFSVATALKGTARLGKGTAWPRAATARVGAERVGVAMAMNGA